MSKFISNLSTGILVLAALVVAALTVQREVVSRARVREVVRPRHVENWQQYLAGGHTIGTSSAPVQIVEFGDFQCPFCAIMHAHVRALLREYPQDLAIVYRHLPLQIHGAAVPAALASECAAAQGQFESYSDLLFAEQQWIGVRDWEDFAAEAGVRDSVAFARCVRAKDFIGRVKADIAVARELRITTTPTFIIDGMLVTGLRNDELTDRVSQAIKKARREHAVR